MTSEEEASGLSGYRALIQEVWLITRQIFRADNRPLNAHEYVGPDEALKAVLRVLKHVEVPTAERVWLVSELIAIKRIGTRPRAEAYEPQWVSRAQRLLEAAIHSLAQRFSLNELLRKEIAKMKAGTE